MTFAKTPPAGWRMTVLALAAICCLAGAAPALAGETMYQFEGFQFTSSQRDRYREGVSQLQAGVEALGRSEWDSAARKCSSAYNIFIEIRLPEMGKGKDIYNMARSCVADAHAAQGNWDNACSLYKRTGYVSLRIRNPRENCAKFAPDDDATLANHSNYARTFAAFGERQAELSAQPEGPARSAVAEKMFSNCQALGNFKDTVPPAIAAAGYCFGIVLVERGNTKKACEVWWLSARNIKAAMAKPMMEVQQRNAINIRDNLESLRPYCADEGYRWPAFDQAWPY